jgi:hypothetical protein
VALSFRFIVVRLFFCWFIEVVSGRPQGGIPRLHPARFWRSRSAGFHGGFGMDFSSPSGHARPTARMPLFLLGHPSFHLKKVPLLIERNLNMGMDVFGNLPTSEKGAYFRDNIWGWYPLWEYCEQIAPDIIPADNLGYTNNNWGLDEEASLALADRLADTLSSGETQAYEAQYAAYLNALPPVPCHFCGGTGHRVKPPKTGPGPLPCGRCDGTGKIPDIDTHNYFTVDNVREFEAFLRDCGGFRIG